MMRKTSIQPEVMSNFALKAYFEMYPSFHEVEKIFKYDNEKISNYSHVIKKI